MDSNIFHGREIQLPLEEFLKLIEGKEINELKFGDEPLIFGLIDFKRYEIIERLFESGKINTNIRNNRGDTPLNACCYNDDIDMVELFLDGGVDINIRCKRKLTPLHEACYGGNIELIKLLLDRGADIHAKMKYGNTPLFCIPMNDTDIAELLLERGADIDEKEDSGLTVLHCACSDRYLNMIEFLLQRGARVEYETNDVQVGSSSEDPTDFPTCLNYKLYTLEDNKEMLKLIESYRGKNIKSARRKY